jgi:hypothetical protein
MSKCMDPACIANRKSRTHINYRLLKAVMLLRQHKIPWDAEIADELYLHPEKYQARDPQPNWLERAIFTMFGVFLVLFGLLLFSLL